MEPQPIQQQLRDTARAMYLNHVPYIASLKLFKRQLILAALERNHWNQCQAADDLHMHRNTLGRTLDELGIVLVSKGGKKNVKRVLRVEQRSA